MWNFTTSSLTLNPLKSLQPDSLQPDIMCPVRKTKGSRGLVGENGNCVCGLIALPHYPTALSPQHCWRRDFQRGRELTNISVITAFFIGN